MGRFHFDFGNYLKMVRLARQEPDRARRRSLYRTFFLVVPAMASLHAVCFALDPVVHPGLRRTPVRAPVFGIGHARSGTTLLHRLMAADEERFSHFLLYEMFFPSLIEKEVLRAVLRVDARFLGGRLRRRIDDWDERKFRRSQGMHESGLFAAEEDGFVMALSCSSGFWAVLLPLMGKADTYHVDRWPARKRERHMRFYKECVRRQLYLNGAHKTHLSKNPGFTGRVEALIETFPDARFVVPVRNPYETIPSLLKLLQTSWELRGRDEAMIRESLRVLVENSYHGYLHPLEVLERHPEVPRVVVDYRDLVSDPAATVRSVYAGLGFEVSPALATRLDRARGRPHTSTHAYGLEEFGLAADEIHERLATLFERFGWDVDEDEEEGVDAGR
jgi:omega-hydroxy-beta-dihydromenaquinone-9 sulfotransferase